MNCTIAIDVKSEAQSGAYQPHVRTATLAYTGASRHDLPRDEDAVKAHARTLVGSFRERGDGDTSIGAFYAPRLADLSRTDDGADELVAVYSLRIETPYQD